MRAAYYDVNGIASDVLKVGDVATPSPGPGEVRVKLKTSGVNPSDVKSRLGLTRKMAFPRVIPHSDGAGEIDAVGDGVATTNLAGRTLSDLIRGEDTELTRLPWVNHKSKLWEPEPFRWLGVNASLKAMASADEAEARSGRPSRRASLVKKIIGA